MPIIRGAASDFTTLARVNATQTTDPEKKSRTFVAPNKAVIAPIVNQLTISRQVRNWKSPPFNGRIYIT
jgi:hypothetical protein